ncbi:hypothetical protein ASF83_15445 [Plantibacter sp. Leaf171]|uniref:DUF4350 domain-containing protein n=1 Tax=unclassified Plantibacter TaxID=2624265 RepID=UPI0007009A21|nr:MULTISPECIES: DUF4350 domain-containing protein [unclassified Plantibacter]KQM14184.1 hypothetical protein ASE44_15460 [Plantibacter sp. Leaf1]KQR57566.1 hypothetical protein ASF83_15445 [Plantibacter sp. Leaf171]
MTLTTKPAAEQQPEPDVATPRLRTRLRRSRFWIVAAVFAIGVALVLMFATRGASIDAALLSPGNQTPNGGRALAQVLRQEGVTVSETTTLDATLQAVEDSESTVLYFDPTGLLDAAQLVRLSDADARLVVVTPRASVLRVLFPGVSFAGSVDASEVLRADCADDTADRAGSVTGGWTLYTSTDADTEGCFTADSGGSAVITQDDGERVLLGSADALTNDAVDRAGNAALALGLLGGTEQLVWYLPSLADVPVTGPPSLDELTPSWVAGVTGTVVITAILAMIWRGRRFGPLVIEDLPVAVRASETMEGRARLYQRSANRRRALDALRIGTVSRLAVATGLSRHASVVEVADTVAGIAGLDPRHVRAVLLDAEPTSDADLVSLSDHLLDLEAAVARATDLTGRNHP